MFHSKFHTTGAPVWVCNAAVAKQAHFPDAGVGPDGAHFSPAGMCHTDTVSGRQTDIRSKEWKFTSQHGEEFRDGQGVRLEEAEV